MMARTKHVRRGYGAGEWGRNRVRVFPDPKTGLFQIEWRDNGRRLTRSLKHRDWRRAKRQADEFAAGYLGPELHRKADAEPEPLTLETLFDIYGEEVTPTKRGAVAAARQGRDEDVPRVLRPGPEARNAVPARLGPVHPGAAGGQGRPERQAGVRPDDRTDLKFLLAVLNWAVKSRDEQGRPALGSESLERPEDAQGEEPDPGRPYRGGIPGTAPRVPEIDWRFHVALVLAHETGHRIGAIRQLQWSDIDLEERVVRWRAEHEKSGYEHRTPVTAEALAALEEARKRNPVTGHTLVLPSPQDPSRCVGSCQARGWWQKAERLAGLEPKRGRGWHSLRRKFASDLMDQPLKVLCELGGWKEAKTVLRCYQQADEVQLRKALESRHKVRA